MPDHSMSDGFDSLPEPTLHSLEAMEAKAEALMEAAIQQMQEIACGFVDRLEPPIPSEQRRAACLQLCAEVFDRLEQPGDDEECQCPTCLGGQLIW